MSRPGDRLRRLAGRACSERTCRRLIEPAIADLQSEFAAARSTGSRWRTLTTLGAGYFSIAKVLAIAVSGDLRHEASTWQPEERAGARRAALVAIGATAVATASLILLAVSSTSAPEGDWALLSLYLTPSTLPMTAPLGLVLGVAWAFHGAARTRKLAVAASIGAVLCSFAMFVNLGWVTPETNQAYRETRFAQEFNDGSAPPLQRGFFELSWSGKRARLAEARAIESPHEVRYLEAAFHRQIAMTVAPVALVGLMLALTFRCRWGRSYLMAAAVAVGVAHPLLAMTSSFYGARLTAPPIAIGWSATALCAAAAVLVTLMRPRRRA